MSYLEIYEIDFTNKVIEQQQELRNSHGFHTFVWDLMSTFVDVEKYGTDLGDGEGKKFYYMFGLSSETNPLWALSKREDIPIELRYVHTMTYDNVYIKKKDYPLMASYLEKFLDYFKDKISETRVNHLPKLINILKEIDYEAVAFSTSLIWCPFYDYIDEDHKDYNEEEEEANIIYHFDKLWDLFEGELKVTVLGSGSAFTLKNYQTNFLLELPSGYKLLIDCGGDCRHAMNELGLNYHAIDGVYVSHLHNDHIGGLNE